MTTKELQDKELYSFEVKQVKEVEETTVQVDEATKEETKITKKVKKEVPIRISLKKPTRKLIEKADLVYTVKLSELMKLGILTRAMVTKKYADTGGVLSEQEALKLAANYKKYAELQREIVHYSIKQDATEEEKDKLIKLSEEMVELRKEIAVTESNYSHIFQHTSDVKAKNHVVLFYCLMLSNIVIEEDGKEPVFTPFFAGETFEEKLEDYYKKEDALDSFYLSVRSKIFWFVTYWFEGAAANRGDFEALEKDIDNNRV